MQPMKAILLNTIRSPALDRLLKRSEQIELCARFDRCPEQLPVCVLDNSVREHTNPLRAESFDGTELWQAATDSGADAILFAVPNPSLKQVCEAFRDMPGVQGYVLPFYSATDSALDAAADLTDLLIPIDLGKPRLKMVQINLAEHCNLNCKGCANYSSLVKQPECSSYAQVARDLRRLRSFFWGIETVKLMGGEPLLNPEAARYPGLVRRLFPDSRIELGTNGLLLGPRQGLLLEAMRQAHAEFVISLYPGTRARKEQLEELLHREKIAYRLFEFRGQFLKYLYERPVYTPEEGYLHCPARECHCLENGWLAVCGRPLYLHRLNRAFGTAIPDGEGKWNIHTLELDPWELDRLLRTPIDTCRYCGPRCRFDWQPGAGRLPEKQDWIVD